MASQELIQLIEALKSNTYSGHKTSVQRTLKPDDYEELLKLIAKNKSFQAFARTDVRHDYSHATHTIILRMPSVTHEAFITHLSREILTNLDLISRNSLDPEIISFVKTVTERRSTSILLQDERDIIRHDADNQFAQSDTIYPTIVFEMSLSQNPEDVSLLAGEYISLSYGEIQVVVGFDIGYGTGNKTSTFSVWRPNFTLDRGVTVVEAVPTISNQVFRDSEGKPNMSPDAGLRLYLKDFASPSIENNPITASDASFLIDSATLYKFLEEAERNPMDG